MKARKLLTLVFAMIFCVAMTLGCSGGGEGQTTPDGPAAPPSNSGQEAGAFLPYSFTDMDGHTVEITKPIESVFIVDMTPLVAVYAYYNNGAEGLVGVPIDSVNIIKESVFAEVYPDILNVPLYDSGVEGTNVEEIAAKNPDVVFYTGGREETYEALTNAGLTAVAFTTAMTQDSNAMKNLADWLAQLDKVFNVESASRSAKLIGYNDEVLSELSALSASIPDEEKPSAIIIFALGDDTLQIAGGGHYSDFWLNNSGARNAAAELERIKPVNMEQLQKWNPEIIYITNFNKGVPEDLYNNTFAGFDWSEIDAVKNKRVYKIPLGSYRWYAPSNEGALMLQWMYKHNQPVRASELDVEAEILSFFKEFYNIELTNEQMDALLNPSNRNIMQHS
jgi:iron complex transport system substrate-binding protein